MNLGNPHLEIETPAPAPCFELVLKLHFTLTDIIIIILVSPIERVFFGRSSLFLSISRSRHESIDY